MNLLKKDSGDITIFGLDQNKYNQEIKSRIGFVYDENCFYDTLTIKELRKIIAPMYPKWNDDLFINMSTNFVYRRNSRLKAFPKE